MLLMRRNFKMSYTFKTAKLHVWSASTSYISVWEGKRISICSQGESQGMGLIYRHKCVSALHPILQPFFAMGLGAAQLPWEATGKTHVHVSG